MVVDHLDDADLVFAVGTSLRDWWMSPRVPKEAVLIHATLDDRDLNKDHAAHHAIFGDAKLVLSAMVVGDEGPARLGSSPLRAAPRVDPPLEAGVAGPLGREAQLRRRSRSIRIG